MYNFDIENNRRNTDSYRWHIKENEVSLDVADMDFRVSNEIIKGFEERINQGIFGYTYYIDEWFEAYIKWNKIKHNLEIDKDWLSFSTGVVPSISSTIRALTNVGDKVCVMQPVYNIFFNSVINNKRILVSSDLIYENGRYRINFEDLRNKLDDPTCKLLILCNPHNPVGRVWSREELELVGKIAKETNTIVLSDEIHCDLTNPGISYTPFIGVNEINRDNAIMCVSPTKTFNLAGIQTSAIIIPNENIRKLVLRQLNTDECAEGNVLAMIAPKLAYLESNIWYEEMINYIYENKLFVTDYINKNINELSVVESEGLYLMWIDISKISRNCMVFCQKLTVETGLKVIEGTHYGPSGEGFIRVNVATNRSRLSYALDKLKDFVKNYKE